MEFVKTNELAYRQWKRNIDADFPRRDSPDIFPLREGVSDLRKLRVAAIMDPFSVLSYGPECDLLNLDGVNYAEELERFRPDLFLFESVWQGKDNAWKADVRDPSPRFQEVVAWCRAHKVPVAFWNKEDPVHTNRFKYAAEMADFVFTTEADLIPHYKAWLGHDRIYHLHFAAQPAQHNPIELYERRAKPCYAGSWYAKYAYRDIILGDYLSMLKEKTGVDIYDRNYNIPDTVNVFPPEYHPYILGSLPPEKIDVAYKGYDYGLNMCSATETGTMFARRVFELGASNTLIISNYSYGLRRYFGDLVICTDDMEEAARQLDTRFSGVSGRRIRLLMLRKVLREHLYEDRLDRIVSIVFGVHLKRKLPEIYIVDIGRDEAEHARIRASFDAQTYASRHLVSPREIADIPDNAFVGVFSPRDHYGENYLTDLILSVRYCDRDGFVKPASPDDAYRPTDKAPLRRGIVRMDVLRARGCGFEEDSAAEGDFLCIDEFNYQPDRFDSWTAELDDILVEDQGLPLRELEADIPYEPEWQRLTAENLYDGAADTRKIDPETLRTELSPGMLLVTNDAEKGVVYKRITGVLSSEKYAALENRLELCIDVEPVRGKSPEIACLFLTQGKKPAVFGPVFITPNETCRVLGPARSSAFYLSIRLEAGSAAGIRGLTLRKANDPLWFSRVGKTETAAVTDAYPRYDLPDRNVIAHERVLGRKKPEEPFLVFCSDNTEKEQIWRFDGQDVFSLHSAGLDVALKQMKTVYALSVDDDIWSVLEKHLDHIGLTVYCDGADPAGKKFSESLRAKRERVRLWKRIFERARESRICFAAVSETQAARIAKKYGLDTEYVRRYFKISD